MKRESTPVTQKESAMTRPALTVKIVTLKEEHKSKDLVVVLPLEMEHLTQTAITKETAKTQTRIAFTIPAKTVIVTMKKQHKSKN